MLDFIGKFNSSYIGSRLIFEKSYLSILNLVEEMDEIEKSDFEYKWLGEMPYSDLKELYYIHKTKGKDAVNSYFLHFFKQEENISKLIEFLQTDQYFAPRIHILQDALYAHLNSKYTLSIPVLYSQIDGIVVDVAVAGGIKRIEIKDKTNPKKPKIVFQTSDGSRVRNYDFANVIDEYNEIKGFFFDKLAKYLKDDLYFERNDILHGRKIDYNTETNSMRLILILLELKGNYEIV
jgi:hypothetical protein